MILAIKNVRVWVAFTILSKLCFRSSHLEHFVVDSEFYQILEESIPRQI